MAAEYYPFGGYKISESVVFYTTQLAFAFVNVCPVRPDVLVCPKRGVKRVADLTSDEICDLWLTAQKIGRQLESYDNASSLTLYIQDGPQAGQSVPHVHIHVIPRRDGDFENNDDIYNEIDLKEKQLKRRLDNDESREATLRGWLQRQMNTENFYHENLSCEIKVESSHILS